MIARPFAADELPAQFDDLRQIKIIPFCLAIIHTLKARVEAASNMDGDCLRVARQKISCVAIELSVTQDNLLLSSLYVMPRSASTRSSSAGS